MSETENISGERPVAPTPKRRRVLRVFIRILLVIAIVVVLGGLYLVSFILGKPKPTVDYLALLNQMTKVEGRSEADNAWPDYEKAIQLHTWDDNDTVLNRVLDGSFRPFRDLNEPQQKAMETWVQRNEDAWKAFVQAANKPYCWREYRLLGPNDLNPDFVMSDAPMMRIDMAPFKSLHELWVLGYWRVRAQSGHGRPQAALDDCTALIRAGRHWSENKTVIESLMGMHISSIGYYGLLATLAESSASDADLVPLERWLRTIHPRPEGIVDLRAERLTFLDIVQHSFTRGGIGGGHLIPRSVWPLVCGNSVVITMSPLASNPDLQQRVLYTVMALVHARRDATVSRYESLYEQANRIIALTPFKARTSGLSLPIKAPDIFNRQFHFDSFVGEARYFVVAALLSPLPKLGALGYEIRTLHEAVLTILAVRRYQADKGRCPETLEELAQAGYLDHVPLDPYSDKPLVYRRTGGDFILYSVGRDMKDDGGTTSQFGGRPERWGAPDKGDAVLWPPQ